jgi:hypothetical protein
LQDLELNDHILTITLNESATPIDMSSYLDNTDEQDLSLTGTTLSLTNDDTPVDLATLPGLGDDADADPQNEIQDLALSGNELSLTNNPFATAIDLSPYLDNTDGQDLSLTGTTLNLTGDATPVDLGSLPGLGDDADADPANELQDLQLSGNFLSLTGLTLATQIDLSPYDNSDLPEGHIFIGNASDQAEAMEVTGDLELDVNGEVRVTGLQSVNVSNEAPEDGEVLVYDDLSNEWVPQSIVPSVSATTKYYSVDPMDFVELVDVSSGNDLDEGNALKFYDARAPFAMIFNSGSVRTIGAPLHLPHGAEIQNIRIFYKDDGGGVMQFRLARKNVTDYSSGNEALLLAVSALAFGNSFVDIPVNNSNIIDNSQYIYRLLVRFTDPEDDEQPDIDDIEQLVYGAVIQYTMN